MLDEPFLLEWRKNRKTQNEVRKGLDVLEDAYKCKIEELYSKENDMENQKKVIGEMETITDQYEEAVDRATSHFPVVKPKIFVNGNRINKTKKHFW